jgi:hypothetical protein
VTRSQLVGVLCGLLAVIALAYFGLLAAQPQAIARILLSRGYAERGWTQERLAGRVRVLAILGAVVALAAIVLAVKLSVG